jgi:hypothetical protein
MKRTVVSVLLSAGLCIPLSLKDFSVSPGNDKMKHVPLDYRDLAPRRGRGV